MSVHRKRRRRGCSSTSELFRLPEWWEEILASGQGSFGERSPLGSRFPESLFLVVPGTATEQARTCGFRWNSSSINRAPKIRDSVRLNSFESFFSYCRFDLFRNVRDVFLSHFWIKRVLRLTVLDIFRHFSRNCRYFSLIPQNCHDTEEKILSAVKTEVEFSFFNQHW